MREGQGQPHEASLLVPPPQHGIHIQQGYCSIPQEGRSPGDLLHYLIAPGIGFLTSTDMIDRVL